MGIWNWWPIGTSVEATEYAIVYIALNKINVAYCHIEMDGGTNIEMTCTHVGQVFGIPHKGRKLFLDSHTNHDAKVPPINEIENQMCDCEVPEEFR